MSGEENQSKKAMSRSFNKEKAASDEDDMTEAMQENRVGAKRKPVPEDKQTKAMSNEFELDDVPGEDDMTKAHTERRSKP